jgi:TonB family protein
MRGQRIIGASGSSQDPAATRWYTQAEKARVARPHAYASVDRGGHLQPGVDMGHCQSVTLRMFCASSATSSRLRLVCIANRGASFAAWRIQMRIAHLMLALTLQGPLGGTDLSGTWTGTWEHQREPEGVCLYLSQGDKGVEGRIAYRHDKKISPIEASLPVQEIISFTIVDNEKGSVNLRLTASQKALTDILAGSATTGTQSEPIALTKYTVPSTFYRHGQGRIDPVPIRTSMPEYTPEARAAKLRGTVTLWVPIESSGAVGPDVKVLRGLGLGLDEEAVKCVKRWQFSPPHYDCNPEPLHKKVAVTFVLR